MLQKMLNEQGLDAHGIAASAGWQVDASYLRISLRKLRALCTHPQACMSFVKSVKITDLAWIGRTAAVAR